MRKSVSSSQLNLVPMFVPKEALKKLLKEHVATVKKKVRKTKLFSDTTKKQIMEKLHRTREQLLKKNPHAYIDYNS